MECEREEGREEDEEELKGEPKAEAVALGWLSAGLRWLSPVGGGVVRGGRDREAWGKPGEDSDSKKLTNSRDREPWERWSGERNEQCHIKRNKINIECTVCMLCVQNSVCCFAPTHRALGGYIHTL